MLAGSLLRLASRGMSNRGPLLFLFHFPIGTICSLEMDEVTNLWSIAAEQGNETAQFNLGLVHDYGEGEGVKQDF